ncbi:uncharacterized protein Z520_12352 [Fonsecaea multimorphosa CBS 102226]|uniref:Uncharacterized protein n=1 Tax=Fonsecaea multimorphosa CBS 102226 TaxID=1442371 RepID=A0A0D2K6G3_9EURO|nr:uncharacterized protein Z520_12352 [Fonsecaea multimorphosa CBS 102226]KIX91963.1 hypothetical protein Z520_12352 [Fonsecaea multimorphosa CBS 102226]
MLWGDIVDKLAFQRALRSHQDHADLRGYPLFLLQKPTIHNFWDKIYFMHWTLVEELAEPEEQRRRWLLWFDADSLILNPSAGLETFLPPENMSQIQFICTKDLNGLNSGVFLFRVSLLTAYYMAKIMAYSMTHPHIDLPKMVARSKSHGIGLQRDRVQRPRCLRAKALDQRLRGGCANW